MTDQNPPESSRAPELRESPQPLSLTPAASLEGRVALLEAQVRAHAGRLAEVYDAARVRRRRGLWIRVVLLLLALAAFFAMRLLGPGSAA